MIKRKKVLAVSLLLSFILAACGGGLGGSTPGPTVTKAPQFLGTVNRTQDECSLDLVTSPLAPGNVNIELDNQTDSTTNYELYRIAEGHTFDELAQHVDEERQLAEAGEPGLGPPAYVDDRHGLLSLGDVKITRVVDLKPGTYAIVCRRKFEGVGDRPFSLLGPIEVEK